MKVPEGSLSHRFKYENCVKDLVSLIPHFEFHGGLDHLESNLNVLVISDRFSEIDMGGILL